MAEYIDREAAIADLELYEKQVVKNEYALAIAGCRSHIRKMPAADVKPVVRCRDCKHRMSCRTQNTWAVPPSDDWFCADGERKEDEVIEYPNCTVQILRNSVTGEESVGWWRNE